MRAAVLGLLLVLTACAAPHHPPPDLTADLTTPTDVTLTWRPVPRDAAATVVEFATDPAGPYTILEFLPPDRTTFHHPDLIPETTFYYRIRPVHGPATGPLDVRLPTPARPVSARQGQPPARPCDPPVPGAACPVPSAGGTDGVRVPADVTATVVGPDEVRFEWTDNSVGEEGFLVESRPAGEREFRVVAVVEPDATSLRLVVLPRERVASHRVRAFRFGAASTVVRRTTGIS